MPTISKPSNPPHTAEKGGDDSRLEPALAGRRRRRRGDGAAGTGAAAGRAPAVVVLAGAGYLSTEGFTLSVLLSVVY